MTTIDLGKIMQGERGTGTYTWIFPDNLTSPASILSAAITAVMRNIDTGAVTAVTGTLIGTAATTFTWARSAADSGTAGAFAVVFRAVVGGVDTYTLDAHLVITDNPAVDTVAGPALVGVATDEAAWLAASEAGGALGTAAYQPATAFQPADADLTAIAGLSSADSNIIVGSATGWVAESGATARTSLGAANVAHYAGVLSPAWLTFTLLNAAYQTAVGAAPVSGATATVVNSGVYYHAVYDSAGTRWRLMNWATGAVTSLIDYNAKVLSYSPFAYWPMGELSGTVADNAQGTAALDGTYSGVTLANLAGPDNAPTPLFDGVNDFLNIYTAGFASGLTPQLMSISMWLKAVDAAVWTDGTARRGILIRVNGNNYITIARVTTNNVLQYQYVAGSGPVAKTINKTALSTAAWFHVGITVSLAADRFICYYNGVQEGATQTGIGIFAGALDAARVAVGCDNTTTPAAVWNGNIAHVAIFNSELSAANMLALATPGS